MRTRPRSLATALALGSSLLLSATAGCAGLEGSGEEAGDIQVYSARHYELEEAFTAFEKDTGLKVDFLFDWTLSPSSNSAVTTSCCASRCCPSADRSASCDRSAARGPVSTPSEVALSGKSFKRLLARLSSSAAAPASSVAAAAAGA